MPIEILKANARLHAEPGCQCIVENKYELPINRDAVAILKAFRRGRITEDSFGNRYRIIFAKTKRGVRSVQFHTKSVFCD